MSGTKKHRVLKVVIAVVVLLICAIVALPFLIDANQFRPQLQSSLSDAVGREVSLGTLKLSLLSGSIVVEEIAIADNPGFSRSPFLKARSFRAAVELMPLIFSKSLKIKGISIDAPEISLIRVKDTWNFSDLGGKEGDKNRGAGNPEPGAGIAGDISIKQLKISNGKVTVQKEGQSPSVYQEVEITADDVSFTSEFPFSITALLPGGGNVKLNGKAGPLNNEDLVLTPISAELGVEDFDVIASGFVPADSGIAGLVDFKGTVESDGARVKTKGRAAAERLQLVRSGSPAAGVVSLGYAADYDLTNRNGALSDVTLEYGKAVAHLHGTYDASGDSLNLKMRLHGAGMPVQDIAALLPAFGVVLPRGASLQGGSLNADLSAEGPLDRMVTTGMAEMSGTRLVGFDLAGKLSSMAALAGIGSSNEAEIEKFQSGMRMTPEGIQVSELLLIVPALGRLSGDGSIGNDQSMDFTMKAVLKPGGALGSGLSRIAKSGSLEIPFFVRGLASDPKFVPDMKAGTQGLLKSVLGGDSKESENGRSEGIGGTLRNLLKR